MFLMIELTSRTPTYIPLSFASRIFQLYLFQLGIHQSIPPFPSRDHFE